jgi:heme-degrading monooxygenase HmoA
MSAIVIIWQFDINPVSREVFERAYGPNGDWAQLFRRSPDYLDTQLLHDTANSDRYITLDRWRSADALAAFKAANLTDYEALDRRFEALTFSETHMGTFRVSKPADH